MSSSNGSRNDQEQSPGRLAPRPDRLWPRAAPYVGPLLFAVFIVVVWLLLLAVARIVLDPEATTTDSLPAPSAYLAAPLT